MPTNVVLVHGIFESGWNFKKLVPQLERDGHRCWVPPLRPLDGRKGIVDLAVKLKAYIEENIDPDESIVLVGFSMGSIVSRHYLQELDGNRRTAAFFAISGPHQGTWMAYLCYGQGAKDMRPGSTQLMRLKASEDSLRGMPVFAYWTPYETVILPSSSSDWQLARQSVKTSTPLHRLMPRNRFVCAHIRRQLRLLSRQQR
jgi:triacylglycerol lipase